MVSRRVLKSGDGTHPLSFAHCDFNPVWGYGDKDLSEEDIQELQWTAKKQAHLK